MNKTLAIIVSVLALLLIAALVYNASYANNSVQERVPVSVAPLPTTITTTMEEDQLKIEDIRQGSGEAVKEGDSVEVNYTGTLLSGVKFDSSYDHGQTFKFVVGAGQVIAGWDKGLLGMQKGGLRKLIIPSSLAYGQQGISGVIPPNSPLIFEIELISINP